MGSNYTRFVSLLLIFLSIACDALLWANSPSFLAGNVTESLKTSEEPKLLNQLIGQHAPGNRLVFEGDSASRCKCYQSGKDYRIYYKTKLNFGFDCESGNWTSFLKDWLPDKYQNMLQLFYNTSEAKKWHGVYNATQLNDTGWETIKKNWPKSWDLGLKDLDKEVVKAKAKQQLYVEVKNLLYQYYEDGGLRLYCEKMAEFYYYVCTARKKSFLYCKEPIPSWNTVTDSVAPLVVRLSDSAVHTEFMMVYDLIQSDEGLFKLFNAFDFEELVNQLRGKLPAKIYSVKAMCPVCEAFLTSLYNVCGCEGVFISKWNDYNSPLGPDGYLRKAYIGYSKKGGTYADLPPDNRKKPAH